MWLKALEADRLRNLHGVSLQLPRGLTVVCGGNGQGKTSLLEAVYLLATGRSFRTRHLEETVSEGGGPLKVAGRVVGRAGEARLGVVVDGARRALLVEGRETHPGAFLGRLGVVAMTVDRMGIVRSGPAERRGYVDRGAVGLEPGFVRDLGDYRRLHQRRNALLRARRGSDVELDAWDERLAAAAARVHRVRRDYARRVDRRLGELSRALLPEGRSLRVDYRPSPSRTVEAAEGDLEALYREGFKRGRPRDRALGFTGVGPHRDDLGIYLEDKDLRTFGSAGQVRSAVIALKLVKLVLHREEKGECPLFLLDDFDADLDEARLAALGEFLERGAFQTVAATSKEALVGRIGPAGLRVRMEGGAARPV